MDIFGSMAVEVRNRHEEPDPRVTGQVAHRRASEAVGGRAACSVDNNVGSAPSCFDVGPNGNGPCRIRCNSSTDTPTEVPAGRYNAVGS